MKAKWAVWPLAVMAAMLILALAAAVPSQDQDKRPLQPLLQDFYSGTATVQGLPASAGTRIVACIDGCDQLPERPGHRRPERRLPPPNAGAHR